MSALSLITKGILQECLKTYVYVPKKISIKKQDTKQIKVMKEIKQIKVKKIV